MKEDLILVRLNEVNRHLANITTIEDGIQGVAISSALVAYCNRVKANRETTNRASELLLRHERRLGQLWKQMPKSKGGEDTHRGRHHSTGYKQNPVEKQPKTLKELGIGKRSANRIRELSRASDEAFEHQLNASDEVNPNRVVMELKRTRDQASRESAFKLAGSGKLHSQIILGDFRLQSGKVPNHSVSLIFTDPPYQREAIRLFSGLADFAWAKLTEGGSIIFYVGHLQLPFAFRAFEGKLRHWWTCACLHGGDKALMREYGIRPGWKPMLWFVKDTRHDTRKIVSDVVTGEKAKGFHDWQQHEEDAAYYIENLCPEDGIVCDPFLGSGTTAVAAQSLKRKWIGFEINPKTAAIANKRIQS